MLFKNWLFVVFATVMATCSASFAVAPVSAPSYRLDIAGFHQGSDHGLVTGMNNSAETVFVRMRSFEPGSYWWNGTEEIPLLPGAPLSRSVVYDLDDSGVAVGERIVFGTRHLAMIWEQGAPRELGTLGGLESVASAINDHGVVAGWSTAPSGEKHLFTWNEGFTDHGPLPPSDTCCHDINAINSSRQIVGHSSGSLLDGWLFDDGEFIALPDLNGGFDSTPNDINDAGLIVGASWPDQTDMRPVAWIEGQVRALPLPLGAVGGDARAANELSDVVGTVIVPDSEFDFTVQAAVWSNGEAFLLRDLVSNLEEWRLLHAEDVNDRGQILVFAHSNTHAWRRVILTPVSEPTSVLMAALGAGATIFFMRRSQRFTVSAVQPRRTCPE